MSSLLGDNLSKHLKAEALAVTACGKGVKRTGGRQIRRPRKRLGRIRMRE